MPWRTLVLDGSCIVADKSKGNTVMTDTERFESAIRSSDPAGALRAVVLELAAEGCQNPDIYTRLEKFLLDRRLRADHCECDEDAVLDVMDALAGWCHPAAQLLRQDRT
jgi:hypothetical protein